MFDIFTTVFFFLLAPWKLGVELPVVDCVFLRGDCALFDSFEVSDAMGKEWKNVRMKVLYPTLNGSYLVDPRGSPHPVIIFFGGALMESNRYQWLGSRLVKECGVVYVTTEVVGLHHNRPMLLPLEGGRTQPTSPSPQLTRLFDKLAKLNKNGVLAGHMNLDKVVVGGHSWGGRVALIDAANDKLFPNVVGTFIYAAHACIFPEPGFIPGSVMSLDGRVPTILMIGTKDGRIRMTGSQFWTVFTSSMQPVLRTFKKSIAPGRRCYYVELDGFNHMAAVDPEDDAFPTQLFDGRSPHGKETMTDELFRIISLFVREHAFGDKSAAKDLKKRLFGGSPYVRNAKEKGPSIDNVCAKKEIFQ